MIWNFFFIPPVFIFHMGSTEDLLMFPLYIVIASVKAVLTLKIPRTERRARDKEEKEKAGLRSSSIRMRRFRRPNWDR